MAARRYETLDAMRGIAALAVVVYHLRAFKLTGDLVPHAYLAVDFFFVLSGFVVAHAYGEALLGQMAWRTFAQRRAIRLLPLAILGAAFGLAVLLLKWRLYPAREDPLANIVLSGALNLLMIPSFISGSAYEHGMFPGDGPLWSLFFELVVNLIWAWIGVRLSLRRLAAFTLASALAVLFLSVLHGSTRMGVGPATFWGGLARATFGFSLGVLIYRLRDRLRLRALPLGSAAAAGGLVVAFCAPLWLVHGGGQALAWDLAWIFVILPAIVILAAGQTMPRLIGKLLGEVSYPVYVLHWPCLAVLSGLHQGVLRRVDSTLLCVAALAVIPAFSWTLLKLYDEPLRRRLSGHAGRRTLARPGDAGASFANAARAE